MKKLCQYCNNANKINEEYICLGGKREDIKKFEEDAKKLKEYVYINKCWITK